MSNWLFQGNPKRYPVLDHLLDGEMDVDWSVTRHLDEISGGDNAALWVSGKRAGVCATGYVMDSPYIGRADDEWIEPADRGKELNFAQSNGPRTASIDRYSRVICSPLEGSNRRG